MSVETSEIVYVKLQPWTYWRPESGDAIEGIFTGFHTMDLLTGVPPRDFAPSQEGVGIRGDGGELWFNYYVKAVALFRGAAIPIGTRVRLRYIGWGSMCQDNYELEIAR